MSINSVTFEYLMPACSENFMNITLLMMVVKESGAIIVNNTKK
jgi:hypothetical protein